MRAVLVAAVMATLCLPAAALADEQLTPLAANGDWAAFEHRESMEDPPDFCVAMDIADHFYIRADSNDLELRYEDDSWSLPANVTGNLKIDVNNDKFVLPISGNTNTMVIAVITQDQLQKIVGDMNNVSSMQLTPGAGQPITLSLNGSNQAVTALLTCANISQPGNTGGANPFQSQPGTGSGQ